MDNHQLLQRYFEGRCTPEEREYVQRVLFSQKHEKELENYIQNKWEEIPKDVQPQQDWGLEKTWTNIFGQIQQSNYQGITKNKNHFIAPISTYFSAIAATVVLLIAASVLSYFYLLNQPPKTIAHTPKLLEYRAMPGQKLTVKLADGSAVKLNAGSILWAYESFEGFENRQVKLEGEAFFEVKPDAAHPFVISTGDVATQVLGTSFSVIAYPADNQVCVAVESGKVSVTKKHGALSDSVILLPTEMAQVTTGNEGKIAKKNFDSETVFGWKEGVLVFENDDWPTIEGKLERWYGVEIEVRGKIMVREGFHGRYRQLTIRQTLEAMSFTLGFQYKVDQGKILIKPSSKKS